MTDKKEAHAKGLIHRAAAVFLSDDQGRMYVQVHIKGGGILDHTVGGHIRKGEKYLDGAVRETREEIGLEVELEEIGVVYSDETYTGANFRHMFGVYKVIAPKGWVFEPNDEVAELRLIDIEELLVQMRENPRNFTAGFLKCMEFYCNSRGIEFLLDIKKYKELRLQDYPG